MNPIDENLLRSDPVEFKRWWNDLEVSERQSYSWPAYLGYTNLSGIDFEGADVDHCDFTGADLSETSIENMMTEGQPDIPPSVIVGIDKIARMVKDIVEKAIAVADEHSSGLGGALDVFGLTNESAHFKNLARQQLVEQTLARCSCTINAKNQVVLVRDGMRIPLLTLI